MTRHACAAYTGLHVDVDRIRADNESRTDAQRKSGLIIWSGRESLLPLFHLLLLIANQMRQEEICLSIALLICEVVQLIRRSR